MQQIFQHASLPLAGYGLPAPSLQEIDLPGAGFQKLLNLRKRSTGKLDISVRSNSELSALYVQIRDAKIDQRFKIKASLKEEKNYDSIHA